MTENNLSHIIIGCAIEVHKTLGPGLLESVYRECLSYELRLKGLQVQEELFLPVKYKEMLLKKGYRIDLLVENKVIVELKSTNELIERDSLQLLTYLQLSEKKLGLLINFNTVLLKNGIKRIVNNLWE